jgi:CRP-like cAMP-binding protein
MSDFLQEKQREIKARLDELKPLVAEYERLKDAHDALEGVGRSSSGGSSARSGAAAKPRARRASSGGDGSGQRGRPRGSGPRSKQALELVRSKPGITIPEIAESMGIAQNYLYRVMPELQKDGMVRKEGRGWHPLDAA